MYLQFHEESNSVPGDAGVTFAMFPGKLTSLIGEDTARSRSLISVVGRGRNDVGNDSVLDVPCVLRVVNDLPGELGLEPSS